MKATTKDGVRTYIHVSTGEGEDKKDSALPKDRVEKMRAANEIFTEHSSLTYPETEFETLEEFMEFKVAGELVPTAVRLAWVNRGWTLAQQQAARVLVLDDDPEFVNKDEPVSILEEATSEKERRKATTEQKSRRNLSKYADEDPEGFASMLAEFAQNLPDEMKAKIFAGVAK
jgi:hypothetical protein